MVVFDVVYFFYLAGSLGGVGLFGRSLSGDWRLLVGFTKYIVGLCEERCIILFVFVVFERWCYDN